MGGLSGLEEKQEEEWMLWCREGEMEAEELGGEEEGKFWMEYKNKN